MCGYRSEVPTMILWLQDNLGVNLWNYFTWLAMQENILIFCDPGVEMKAYFLHPGTCLQRS